jgi:hypothetical protein
VYTVTPSNPLCDVTQRFAAVIMRIREPKTTALIFASGKMVRMSLHVRHARAESCSAIGKIIKTCLIRKHTGRVSRSCSHEERILLRRSSFHEFLSILACQFMTVDEWSPQCLPRFRKLRFHSCTSRVEIDMPLIMYKQASKASTLKVQSTHSAIEPVR